MFECGITSRQVVSARSRLVARGLVLALLTALAAGATAQINHPYNEVGIYTVERPDGCETAEVTVPVMTEFTCYVVLTNPYNEALGRPVATLGGFQFRLELPTDVYLMSAQVPWGSMTFPPLAPDFAFGGEAPVTEHGCTLVVLTLMPATADPALVYLVPVQDSPPAIPGEMVFTDFDDSDSLQVMHPVSGSFDVPVFAINWDGDLSFCETVPGAGISFGAVKALYR